MAYLVDVSQVPVPVLGCHPQAQRAATWVLTSQPGQRDSRPGGLLTGIMAPSARGLGVVHDMGLLLAGPGTRSRLRRVYPGRLAKLWKGGPDRY